MRTLFCPLVLLLLLGSGCSKSPPSCSALPIARLTPTTSAAPLPQPPLRGILRYLADHDIAPAGEATVFVLSHWLMYDRVDNEGAVRKRVFEGAPFTVDKAHMFLAVGPVNQWWKHPPPPRDDLLLHSRGKEGAEEVTLLPGGQDWTVGFSMKAGDEPLRRRLTDLLVRWAEEYRAAR